MRIGHGYDAHRLADLRKLILGGVEIPYIKGLLGHSDADVLTHAVIDALLGAACLGDIGTHFPDSDLSYKDISSISLLEKTYETINRAGFFVLNIDATVIAEKPRLSGYIALMRNKIAAALNIPENDISIKATTEEGLGFTGRGEGIAAHAVCLINKVT